MFFSQKETNNIMHAWSRIFKCDLLQESSALPVAIQHLTELRNSVWSMNNWTCSLLLFLQNVFFLISCGTVYNIHPFTKCGDRCCKHLSCCQNLQLTGRPPPSFQDVFICICFTTLNSIAILNSRQNISNCILIIII